MARPSDVRPPPQGPSRSRKLDMALMDWVKRECEHAGVHLDTYDPAFIVASIEAWLGTNNAALTAKGVKRFRHRGRYTSDG